MPSLAQSINANLTDNTKDGQCISCGECCSNMIALTQTDISRIKRYMKKHNIDKPEDHTLVYGLVNHDPARVMDLTCPFLVVEKIGTIPGAQKATCKIYPVRPAVCKAFTCKNAGAKIQEALIKELTPDEIQRMANTPPVSMTTVFFGK